MKCTNRVLHLNGSSFDLVQFGRGKKHLVMIPGLGDGIITVKNKALLGLALYRAYAERYTVTLISRKNELEPDASIESMARDQADAMRALGIGRAHVIGVSQGGMIAQHLAADAPELVDRLVLVVTVPAANALLAQNVHRWLRLSERREFSALMADINEQAHPERYLKRMRWAYPLLGLSAHGADAQRFAIQARACLGHDARGRLAHISAPTLILGGAEDKTLGPTGSRLLANAIPGSRLLIYWGQGHALYQDEKAFHADVLAFLEEE